MVALAYHRYIASPTRGNSAFTRQREIESELGKRLHKLAGPRYLNRGLHGVMPILWFLYRNGQGMRDCDLEMAKYAQRLQKETGYGAAFGWRELNDIRRESGA